jgi:hypothetical protein
MNTGRLRMFLFVGLVVVSSLGLAHEQTPDEERREMMALERRFAGPAFAVVRGADRVDALPVEMTGAGVSATHHVVERPMRLDPATARELRRTTLSAQSYLGGPMACLFQPGLALRFHRGSDRVQVLVCFMCDELIFEKPGGQLIAGKLMFADTFRARLVAIARKALPGLVIPERAATSLLVRFRPPPA